MESVKFKPDGSHVADDCRFCFEKGDVVISKTNQDGLQMGRAYVVARYNHGCRVALVDMPQSYSPFDFMPQSYSPFDFQLSNNNRKVVEPDWQRRVVAERGELNDKLAKLDEFLANTLEGEIPKVTIGMLRKQQLAMRHYRDILNERILAFQVEEAAKDRAEVQLEAIPTQELHAKLGEMLAELLLRDDATPEQLNFLKDLLNTSQDPHTKAAPVAPEWPVAGERYVWEMTKPHAASGLIVRKVEAIAGEWLVHSEGLTAYGTPSGRVTTNDLKRFQEACEPYRYWKLTQESYKCRFTSFL